MPNAPARRKGWRTSRIARHSRARPDHTLSRKGYLIGQRPKGHEQPHGRQLERSGRNTGRSFFVYYPHSSPLPGVGATWGHEGHNPLFLVLLI